MSGDVGHDLTKFVGQQQVVSPATKSKNTRSNLSRNTAIRKITFSVTKTTRTDHQGHRTGWVVELVDGDARFPFSLMFDTKQDATEEATRIAEIVQRGTTDDLPFIEVKEDTHTDVTESG